MYELKVKANSLMAEAWIIKKEEQRVKDNYAKWKYRAELGKIKAAKFDSEKYNSLRLHRVNQVRKEQRCTLLAYGFLRGLKYREMENFAWTQPNWDRVAKLAARYSKNPEQEVLQKFAEWKDEALEGVPARWCETVQPGSMRHHTGNKNPLSSTYNHDWVEMQTKRNLQFQILSQVPNPPLSSEENRVSRQTKPGFFNRVLDAIGL